MLQRFLAFLHSYVFPCGNTNNSQIGNHWQELTTEWNLHQIKQIQSSLSWSPSTAWPSVFVCWKGCMIREWFSSLKLKEKNKWGLESKLGKQSFVKLKIFLWNHFKKRRPPPPSPFYLWSPYFFPIHFVSKKKKWFWKVFERVLKDVLKVFEGCWVVFEECLKK